MARQLHQQIVTTSEQRFIDPAYQAISYIGLGEIDSALSQLSKGYEMHSGHMIYLRGYSDLVLKDILTDSRYENLLENMGFKD